MLTSRSIQYANGTDWEERRKFLYPTLRDEFLKEYIPIFIQVIIRFSLYFYKITLSMSTCSHVDIHVHVHVAFTTKDICTIVHCSLVVLLVITLY